MKLRAGAKCTSKLSSRGKKTRDDFASVSMPGFSAPLPVDRWSRTVEHCSWKCAPVSHYLSAPEGGQGDEVSVSGWTLPRCAVCVCVRACVLLTPLLSVCLDEKQVQFNSEQSILVSFPWQKNKKNNWSNNQGCGIISMLIQCLPQWSWKTKRNVWQPADLSLKLFFFSVLFLRFWSRQLTSLKFSFFIWKI